MMTLREQMLADLLRTLGAVETLCSADDFLYLRRAVDRFAEMPVADTRLGQAEQLRAGMGALRDMAGVVGSRRSSLGAGPARDSPRSGT
jgi:hypothetical protein